MANWSSVINGGGTGFESRRWDDELYSQIKFTDCTPHYLTASKRETDVAIWRDITVLPDDKYDTKTFTACFSGGGTSNGEWTDLGSGKKSVYFRIQSVGGSSTEGSTFDAAFVGVDTTQAD
ncbi:hypothetical protein ACFRDV_35640 [Streptomyces fagopyri]|uniref:hypothetical protein n=1 Tax=Streptomyces fagopyri TaxID=2662397 RepID=UPI0036ADD174